MKEKDFESVHYYYIEKKDDGTVMCIDRTITIPWTEWHYLMCTRSAFRVGSILSHRLRALIERDIKVQKKDCLDLAKSETPVLTGIIRIANDKDVARLNGLLFSRVFPQWKKNSEFEITCFGDQDFKEQYSWTVHTNNQGGARISSIESKVLISNEENNPKWINSIPDYDFVLRKMDALCFEQNLKMWKTGIPAYAMANNQSIDELIIPDEVETIGASAFQNCKNLKTVVFPDSVKSVEEHAFDGCTQLKKVVIGCRVELIDNDAFNGCTSLRSLVLPNSILKLGYNVFLGCTSLEEVVLPGEITIIDDFSFHCSGLYDIVIPASVKEIGNLAFSQCESLRAIKIPQGVQRIGWECLAYCPALSTIHYEGSIEQWNSIIKGEDWIKGSGRLIVICKDGTVSIDGDVIDEDDE